MAPQPDSLNLTDGLQKPQTCNPVESGNFNGGGSTSAGIGVNQTGTFVFNVSGTGLDTKTEADFANELSSGGFGFIVRLRGFEDGGSAKVPGQLVLEDTQMAPEPSTLATGLIGFATVAVVGYIRRRRWAGVDAA